MNHGIIKSLWRYPVKSLIGESLEKAELNFRGVMGDRVYAVTDSDGKFGSGKNTRRFRRIDGLFSISAILKGEGVEISFPDGHVLTQDDEALNGKLTQFLGPGLRLTKESEIPHFDAGAIHILTRHSLLQLKKILPDAGINERRFRPNMVIETDLSDEKLLGSTIKIGRVELVVSHKTERCRMITLHQAGLENRPEILKVVSKNFGLKLGVYAKVIKPGCLTLGDNLEILTE